MTMHAYDQLYLSKASHAMGNMLHDAVLEFGRCGADFLKRFIQSGIAEQFEEGSPKYIAGKSGLELFLEVMEKTEAKSDPKYFSEGRERTEKQDFRLGDIGNIESYERSPEYWVGWVLAHYQWYSGRSFRHILDTISYEELLSLYGTMHEADISKSYEVMDAHFAMGESKLKTERKLCGITQETLSQISCVSLNSIKAYERKSKDLNKAQADTIMKLAKALKCELSELID